jgi:hypothetical protein
MIKKILTIVSETEKSIKNNGIDDFEINSTIAGLFAQTQEYTIYYFSLKKVENKRDFSSRLIEALEKILLFIDNKEVSLELEKLLNAVSKIGNITPETKVNKEAKNILPRGYDLLEIKDDLTLDYLKQCYRKACKKHHPDLGGNEEKMKIINEAYAVFNKILSDFEYGSNYEENIRVEPVHLTAKAYFIYLLEVLVAVYTDIMAVDKACDALNRISKLTADITFNSYCSSDRVELAATLCKRLST